MCGTRLYDIWRDMRHRCTCKNMRNYKHYGGRGISVCEEWNDFVNFYNWAMSTGYSDTLTIDRIDVNGNYEPSNCRWVNMSVQNANRRNAGATEYIGVSLHSNKSCYVAFVKCNGKVVFYYSNASKNECARKRNEFILQSKMDYPLNDIKPEYEKVRKHKNEYQYLAKNIDSGYVYKAKTIVDLANKLGLTPQFISDCLRKHRNSKKYIFSREEVSCLS